MHYINLVFFVVISAIFAFLLSAITKDLQSDDITQRYYQELLAAIRKGAIAQVLGEDLHWSANYHLKSDLVKDEMVDAFYQNTASLFGYDDLPIFSSFLSELTNYVFSQVIFIDEKVFETPMQELIALTEEAMLAQALSTSWGHHFSNHYKEAFSFSQKIKTNSAIKNFFIKTHDYQDKNEIERFTNELNYYYIYIKSFLY